MFVHTVLSGKKKPLSKGLLLDICVPCAKIQPSLPIGLTGAQEVGNISGSFCCF